MVVLGFVLLLLLITVPTKMNVDPLFYGTTRPMQTSASISEINVSFHCASLCPFSICSVSLHLHGGPDECSRARWVHLRLHGFLHKDGKRTHIELNISPLCLRGLLNNGLNFRLLHLQR